MGEKFTDKYLVKKSLEDVTFFADLIARYEGKLLNYILRISSLPVEEAEEALQEIFLKTWRNLRAFDQTLKFSTWIYRIAYNHTISLHRKRESRGQSTQISIEAEKLDFLADSDLLADFDQQVSSENIQAVLDEMPDKYRDILVLKFLEEKSYDEISDILRKPLGTVATLINRAKKSFRATAQNLNIKF